MDPSGINFMQKAYIGIGSNMGDSVATTHSALAALAGLPETILLSTSMLYRSFPLGPIYQPDFINAVSAIRTSLAPLSLLSWLQSIEQRHGRTRDGARWGPRTLDLDLLLYGELRIVEDVLTVPHPALCERAFVLYPLYEIAPELKVPGHGPLVELLERVAGQRVRIADCRGNPLAGSISV
uniref:2-amino-4-hydroxy-6-hydroxymethyldihydropteridine pyrophosphokinase n=1 Tax=Candidatus Kentrum sp. SD TaxID=2126332 RepID=A0A450Z7N6_9GAMM|nr:MAG: 2-amino-4-hydroxy-6-hydroxymethyldihydropteridinediphosphokinase [Candidatus Kentron sp. SD]VFK49789.1 MAG: 2-amino-4-hydroxy-6-hydroxymethyldihydropteridinediphosphokinase [Candidatus Kentron sp. SD]VFK81161.1 MAG: 2-amino-4-hydroxy-6-hydroxymethyldihydropteridinediphosphokinase [Candidatus Kentron sp. SD]